jgi:hypothetical protein
MQAMKRMSDLSPHRPGRGADGGVLSKVVRRIPDTALPGSGARCSVQRREGSAACHPEGLPRETAEVEPGAPVATKGESTPEEGQGCKWRWTMAGAGLPRTASGGKGRAPSPASGPTTRVSPAPAQQLLEVGEGEPPCVSVVVASAERPS